MAALSSADRDLVHRMFVDEMGSVREAIGLTKPELRAALSALDDYLDANATAINQAIPQPARGSLTAKQKARLLAYVALKRYGVI